MSFIYNQELRVYPKIAVAVWIFLLVIFQPYYLNYHR